MIVVSHPKRPIKSKDLLVGPRLVSLFFISLLTFALIGKLAVEVKKIITPPKISLESPRNGELTHDPAVEVRGQTETGTELALNGQRIEMNKNGSFKELLPLQPVLNLIKISARKRYSKPRRLELRVIYEQNKDLTYKLRTTN